MTKLNLKNNSSIYLVGIDEVGRGPIAGPVTVCVFIVPPGVRLSTKSKKLKLRDSKKLSPARREEWFAQIKLWQLQKKVDFAVVSISAKVIDQKGISYAISSAISKALTQLDVPHNAILMLDGGLKAPVEFKNQKTIIKGDEKIPVISYASICAKVTRDSYMRTISKKYPHYLFWKNKGYGTKEHYKHIGAQGLSVLHRRSFLKKYL